LITDEVHRYLERQSALLRYTNKDFTLLLQAFSDTTVGINDAYTDESTLQPLILDTSGQLIHIENSWNFTNSRATVFSDFNYYTFDFQLNNLFAPGVHALVTKGDGKDDYRYRIGGSFDYRMDDSLDLVVGVEHEVRAIGNYHFFLLETPDMPLATFLQKGKVGEFSAYTQLDYSNDRWRFIIGGRYTDNELSGHKTTPRLAVVYKIDEYQSLKTLYSTGFNSPNPTQASINAPGNVVGNEALTAEVVKTFDIAYSYSKSNVLFVANIYSLEAEDFIQRRYSEAVSSVSFFNEGNFKRKGAEIDFQMASQGSKLFVNLAYQKEGNKILSDDPEAFNTPRLTLSMGASTDLWENHSIGGHISYIGARHNLDAYTVVNANYTVLLSDVELFLVVRNIFDENILNPNISSQGSDLVAPGEEGVNAQFGVRVHF